MPECCILSHVLYPLQGFDVAVAVLNAVNAVLPISVTWVCQNEPEEAHLPVLGRCNLTFDLHVNVPQVYTIPVQPRCCEHDRFFATRCL